MHVLQDLHHALLQLVLQYESIPASISPSYSTGELPAIEPHMVQPLLLVNINPHFLIRHFPKAHQSVLPSCFCWFQATMQQCMINIAKE